MEADAAESRAASQVRDVSKSRKGSQGPKSAIPEGATKDDLKEVVQELQSQNRELATMIQQISEMQLQSVCGLSQQTSEFTKVVAQMAESIENAKGDKADEFLRSAVIVEHHRLDADHHVDRQTIPGKEKCAARHVLMDIMLS